MTWNLSPSGWPTWADPGSDMEFDLADRGYTVIDESDVQAAIDAFHAGLPPVLDDVVTVAELQSPSSPASVALRAALVARASGMNDAPTADNRAYLQSLLDDGGLVILPRTADWYGIDGPLVMNVPGTQVILRGAPLRQLTRGQPWFEAVAPDCLIDGLDATGTPGTPDLSGMSGSWQGSILASQWTAVNIYDSAHRLRIPWIRGQGMSSVVRVAGWTKATDVEATTRVKDVEIGTIFCDRVEFGIAAKGTERIRLGSVRGTYGNVANPPRSAHLVYFADAGGGHRQITVGDCAATGGTNGSAYQVKGVAGGQIGRLHADACSGALNVTDCTDVAVADLISLGDTYTGVEASVKIDQTTSTDRIQLRRARVHMTTDQRAVQILAGTNVRIDDLYVRANHTTQGSATQYDVEVRSDGVELRNVEVDNVGTNAWRAVGFWSGSGHVLRGIKARNVRMAVDTRTTNARVEYDRRDITLHAVDGYSQMTASSTGAYGAKFIAPQTAQLLSAPTLLVADTFELPTGTSKGFGSTITGHRWEELSGDWRCDTDTFRGYEFTGATTQAAVVDAAQANVAVECGILFQSGEGLILRALDNLNYIAARFSAGALTLSRFDAGVATTLVTQALATQTGRRYAMAVRAFSDRIDVLVDGVQILTHTLVTGDQTKFGAVTKHGLRSSGSAAARFDSFRVLALS